MNLHKTNKHSDASVNNCMQQREPDHGFMLTVFTVCAGSAFIGGFGISRPGSMANGLAGVVRPAPVPSQSTGPSKRARKDRGPNWLPQEVFALIAAKREMYLEELDTVDGRDLMTPDSSKWQRVSTQIMRLGISPCPRDGAACKTKWNQLIPDYRKIADYLSRTGRNSADYWELNSTERKGEGLPRLFAQDVYYAIHEWFGNRPQIQPPHVRDLLANNDGNYRANSHATQEGDEEVQSEPDTEDPLEGPHPEPVETTEESSPASSQRRSAPTTPRHPVQADAHGSPASRHFSGVLAGITPQVISSSENSQYAVHRRPGNTVYVGRIFLGIQ